MPDQRTSFGHGELPWVKVQHLASHILGRMAMRISDDCRRMYGHPIYFLAPLVDPDRFTAASYRPATRVLLAKATGPRQQCSSYTTNPSSETVLGHPGKTAMR